ncbi:MAG: N-acyl-D-glutamate deacylase [Syntrophomonadaceae bacterium]|nr:N-acyl-D-glutamate deacylase [Bacillota bacterium]MBT9147392.1 N-acyl-D-glutamate deacylase [Bacillota bacterium]
MECDLLIKGGTILDGTGIPGFKGDLAIKGGKIVAVISQKNEPSSENWHAEKQLDATGLIVCPGFIDFHSHSDWILPLPEHPEILKPLLEQGITTVVGGNCGYSPAPLAPNSAHLSLIQANAHFLSERPLDLSWTSLDSFLSVLENKGISLNLAMFTGQGTLRWSLLGKNYSYPGEGAMERMKKLFVESFEEGSYGLSLGLGYEPGIFLEMKELEELAQGVQKHNRLLVVHIKALARLSGAYPLRPFGQDHNLKALGEMIALAENTGVKLQLSHLVFTGKKTWANCDRALEMIEKAQSKGIDLAFDTYPYFCANTTIYIIYPAWFLANIGQNLRNPLARLRLAIEMKIITSSIGYGLGDIQLLWGGHPDAEQYNGLFFDEIARIMNCPILNAHLKISELSKGKALCLIHKLSGDEHDEETYLKLLTHSLNIFETDAVIISRGIRSRAAFGSFPRIIEHYHKKLGVITLAEAIAKMTGRAAERLGLDDRGTLCKNNWADITIFDYDKIKDNTSRTRQEERPTGIKFVYINGVEVVREGTALPGKLSGQILRSS